MADSERLLKQHGENKLFKSEDGTLIGMTNSDNTGPNRIAVPTFDEQFPSSDE